MPGEKDKHEAAGTLTYNSAWNALALDGYELHGGQCMEVSVFGYWIPGQLALDAAGWYLLTLDHVSIRLQGGLYARLARRHTMLFVLSYNHHRCTHRTSSLLMTIRLCFKPSP